MGALIAIGSIFALLYVKKHTGALAAVGSTAGISSGPITGAPDPSLSYDTKAPMQADPIGNTHLSIADPVYNAAGEVVALPYRPSDPAYGGGITGYYADFIADPNPAGSPGSGIGTIEQLNAPHAAAPVAGGATGSRVPASSLSAFALFQRLRTPGQALPAPAQQKLGDSGSGQLPVAPAGVSGPAVRHPISPLRPSIVVAHAPVSQLVAAKTATPPTPAARPTSQLAGRRVFLQ